MAITAGVLSQVSVSSNSDSISATATTGGTAPYGYQYYRSVVSGFTPGAGNLIAGATSLILNDSGLIPNTAYFYKLVATDAVAATVTYTQLAVTTTASSMSQNQFAQSETLGTIDLRYNYDTVSAQVASSQSGGIYAGQAVKLVPSTSPNSAPKVVACSANSDVVVGFINFDIKTVQYVAGSVCEMSQAGNVMYLYSTGAITQGSQVTLDVTSPGAVAQKVTSSGATIVGWAYDGAAAAGSLIRVKLTCPSFTVA